MRHSNPIWGILAFVFLTSQILTPTQAQTAYSVNACTEVDDGAGNGTPTAPFSSLLDAIATSAPGSTLVIQAGNYPETPTIQKNLTLNASGGTVVLGRPLSTQKICQLTGERDLFSSGQQFTVNRTETHYGLAGTDLGASFAHNGRIYFLFGDTASSVGYSDDDGDRPENGDSVAWVPADADPEQCLQSADPPPTSITPLTFLTAPDGKYLSPRVLNGSQIISRAGFEVPLSGFSANGNLYAFFSTDSDPQIVPACSHETMGRSVLGRLDDESQNRFTYLYDVSCRPGNAACSVPNPGLCSAPPGSAGYFINISPVIVNNLDVPGLPADVADPSGKGLLLWGSGHYRCSNVYLAYVPLNNIEDSSRRMWRYAVLDTSGNIQWSGCEADAIPLLPSQPPCIGELSVTWNPFLHKWLMLYNCPNAIYYRTADQPWGPWSVALVLLDPACDRGYCHFIHSEHCCDFQSPTCAAGNAKDDLVGSADRSAGPYAPYVISSLTKGDATSTTIYWLVSTWNPYEVVLMKSTLQLDCACRAL